MIWLFYTLLEIFIWHSRLRGMITSHPLVHLAASALSDVLWVPVVITLCYYIAKLGAAGLSSLSARTAWAYVTISGSLALWLDGTIAFKATGVLSIAFILVWMREVIRGRKIRISALCFATALLVLILHYNSQLLPRVFPGSGSIQLITFNMNTGMAFDDKRTVQFIKEQLPDIIFLQEISRREKKILLSDLEPFYPYHFGQENGHGENDALILSRTAILEARTVPLKTAFAKRYKVASHITIDVDGHVVHMINCHLTHPVRYVAKALAASDSQQVYKNELRRAALRQREEARLLADYIRRLEGPVILAGDFNATPGSDIYYQFSSFLNNAFADVGFGLGTTFGEWTLQQKLTSWLRFLAFDYLRIDHIFYSNDFRVHRAFVAQLGAFDHRPLIVNVQLKKGE